MKSAYGEQRLSIAEPLSEIGRPFPGRNPRPGSFGRSGELPGGGDVEEGHGYPDLLGRIGAGCTSRMRKNMLIPILPDPSSLEVYSDQQAG